MRERSTRPDRKYAAVPNSMMRDKAMSMDARGLLALLMTYSDDWEFSRDHLLDVTGWGKDKFGAVMKQLIDLGYVEPVRTRDENGRLVGRNWIIRDEPGTVVRKMPTMDTVVRENRRPENTVVGEIRPLRRLIEEVKKTKEEEITPTPSGQGLFDGLEEPKNEGPDHFEAFWKAYPDSVRKTDKPKARKLFWSIVHGKAKAVAKAAPETLIAAAERYRASAPDPQFVPMPTTWLNGERWTQHQEPIRRATLKPQWGEVVR